MHRSLQLEGVGQRQLPRETTINKEEAKRAIVREWDIWAHTNIPEGKKPNGMDGVLFYGDLTRKRRELLSFRATGDKWQHVHSFLLRARRVSD